MEELIETYNRRIATILPMIERAKDNEDKERETRLRIKAGCYRTFLTELKRELNN